MRVPFIFIYQMEEKRMNYCVNPCSDPCEGPVLRCADKKSILDAAPSTDEKELNLQEQFIRIGGLLRRLSGKNRGDGSHGANPYQGQGRVLRLLQMNPEITQKELSFLLDMRPQSLGELLMKLERSGCITRAASENDKRAMDICLTDEGLEAANKAGEEADSTGLFSSLSKDEQAALGGYLGRIITELENSSGEDDSDPRHKRGRERGASEERHGRKDDGRHGRKDDDQSQKHGNDDGRHGHKDDDRHGRKDDGRHGRKDDDRS